MNKILLAGATGYLGGHIANELVKRDYVVRAITRNVKKLQQAHPQIDDIFEGMLTKQETIAGCCEGIDVVISTVGITRQKDGLTYMDVDYGANLNLLNEATAHGVKKFIYIFIFNAKKMKELKLIQAKQKFTDELKASGISYTIINPTGFFSDMDEFFKMAKKGSVFLFGKKIFKMNPIDGNDLARVCVDAIETRETEINVGGPQTFTYEQIAETAFRVLIMPVKIRYIPMSIVKGILFLLRTFTRVSAYGPVEFFIAVLTMDMVAPVFGTHTLEEHYLELANQASM